MLNSTTEAEARLKCRKKYAKDVSYQNGED
jgi:hypothetical protein